CAYCYARPYHEYLGFNAGLDFESKIMVKPRAAELLEEALARRSWRPEVLACSGVTDCYQPVERELQMTRQCLEVLAEFRNPVAMITKNHLITRDVDLLGSLAEHGAAAAVISVTTLDAELARVMEPRASTPKFRLDALRELSAAGIPTGVSLAPVIPGLNEHEMPAILEAAAGCGASFAFYTVVRLPHGVKDLFDTWLAEHVPGQRDKVLGRIRELRDGDLNESEFGTRMRGSGRLADELSRMFRVACRKHGLNRKRVELSIDAFRRVSPGQMELF
ncbi:MAG: PA0069 family radical SAM protein, partial [Verrucomicrobiales bacterium]